MEEAGRAQARRAEHGTVEPNPLAAAYALADHTAERYVPQGLVYPPVDDLREACIRFAASGFSPCGSDKVWWWDIENVDDPAWLHVDALHDRSCEERDHPYCGLIYVELDASVSAPGKYGHLGMYDRLLIVSRVRYASLAIPAHCEIPGDA